MKRRGVAAKKVLKWTLAIVAIGLIGVGAFYGPVIADFARAGFFEKPPEKQHWTPETEKNLLALYTALKTQHDSDDAFPAADKWMDAIEGRVRTNLLTAEEAKKKFVDPAAGGGEGVFGLAYNEAAAGKYIGDLEDGEATLLVFQSTETGWNAHGDPQKIGRQNGIAVNAKGEIVPLSKSAER